jgi:toluene monooxygenase system protein E
MSEEQAAPEVLKPLKTWSHLAGNRRRPSEYEVVSTNLHYRNSNTEAPWEQSPDSYMNEYYNKYCYGSPLKHDDWDAFRDPDELVYRTYNMLQDGQETYVNGLFAQFDEREHDIALEADWVALLPKLYTPSRYVFHTVQMASAYIGQMAPGSTITNCCTFQTGDSIRWLSHTAYRTKELDNHRPDNGFGTTERETWENDAAWQGFRELMEKALVAWDWAESFVAINLVAKPAIEEALLTQLGNTARAQGDTLLGLLTQAQMLDATRHRRWAGDLVKMALETDGNKAVIEGWVAKWTPLADAAIDAYCAALPDSPNAAENAKAATRAVRAGMGLEG